MRALDSYGLHGTRAQLTALTSLSLSGNEVADIPAAMLALTGLEELNLFRNRLVALPTGFGALSALTVRPGPCGVCVWGGVGRCWGESRL